MLRGRHSHYSRGEEQEEVVRKADRAIGCILRRIKEMGLKVAPEKSEAMVFSRKDIKINKDQTGIRIEGRTIKIGQTIRYLGIYLDKDWNFENHFEIVGGRMESAANGLSKLLPNIGGPGEAARKLYAGVVHAIGLYGAPIWWEEIRKNGKIRKRMLGVQKRMAIRMVRAYRTVAGTAVMLLAGIPPFELLAETNAKVYMILEDLKTRGINGKGRIGEKIRTLEKAKMRKEWKRGLEERKGNEGARIIDAIIPNMEEWLDRSKKVLTYRMTQIITGHGCFNAYLHRIGKENSRACTYCVAGIDDAQHTLEHCEEWKEEREQLRRVLGSADLGLENIIKLISVD